MYLNIFLKNNSTKYQFSYIYIYMYAITLKQTYYKIISVSKIARYLHNAIIHDNK